MGRHEERLVSVWEVEGYDPLAQERSIADLAARVLEAKGEAGSERRRSGHRKHPEWTEAQGAESVANVIRVLGDKSLFPWIEQIEETERWSDEDDVRKTDLVVYVGSDWLAKDGLVDMWRVQVKSGWHELTGVGQHGFELCGLAAKKWRELMLVILVGQQTGESIAATFIIQVMNHLHIWGNEAAVRGFMAGQTKELQRIVSRYLAQDLIGRDWQPILDYVRGRKTGKQIGMTRFY